MQNYISGGSLTVSRRKHVNNQSFLYLNTYNFYFIAVLACLPPGGGRGFFSRAAGVMLCPGTQQDGVAAARLRHHELR